MMGKLLKKASEDAVLSANYLKEKLKGDFHLPYDIKCMHEFVLSGEKQVEKGVHTINIAKALMDYDIHPPTVYFPLIVHEAIMIEPTESESIENLDRFVDVMKEIAKMVDDGVDFEEFPKTTPVQKIDEVTCARKPNLKYE
jgi:glycine dehydrogenase subunit 2